MKQLFKKAAILGIAACMALTVTACQSGGTETTPGVTQSNETENSSDQNSQSGETTDVTQTSAAYADISITWANLNEKDDYTDWESEETTSITLTGSGATIEGDGAAWDNGAVTISAEGTYVVSGTLDDGALLVDAGDTDNVRIILNNASLTCTNGAPLYVENADKVILSLPAGTMNSLTDGADYSYPWYDATEAEPSAAIFSKDDLVINGEGTLEITANYNDGITSKDDLKITGGKITITAADDGLIGKDMVAISDGEITINAGGDGVKSTNATDDGKGFVAISGGTLTITAGTDGIQGENAVSVEGGTLTLTTGGGSEVASTKSDSGWGQWGGGIGGKPSGGKGKTFPENTDSAAETENASAQSTDAEAIALTQLAVTTDETQSDSAAASEETAKGLKAGQVLRITGGTLTIDSSDDALHSNGDILIGGGTLDIQSGDDGAHADGLFQIDEGQITIGKSYEGIEGSNITINGGTVTVVSSDDGFNVAGGNDSSSVSGRPGMGQFDATDGMLTITGGLIEVNASGDGLDSNGGIAISGGETYVSGPTNDGNGALDYNGSCDVTGGTLLAAGSLGMAQAPSSCTGVCWAGSATGAEGAEITVTDASGNTVLSWSPAKTFQHVVIVSPLLQTGESYTLSVAGTEAQTATLQAGVNTFGTSGMGGMGGMGGK